MIWPQHFFKNRSTAAWINGHVKGQFTLFNGSWMALEWLLNGFCCSFVMACEKFCVAEKISPVVARWRRSDRGPCGSGSGLGFSLSIHSDDGWPDEETWCRHVVKSRYIRRH